MTKTWKQGLPVGRINLKEVVKDIAGNLNTDYSISISLNAISVRIGEASATASDWDTGHRVFIWLTALTSFSVAYGMEQSSTLPHYLAFFLTLIVFSLIGMFCRAQLESNFNSRVIDQLEQRAKSQAVSFEELACEAIVVFWTLHNRPFGSHVKSLFLNWFSLDNSFDRAVVEPVRKALKLVSEVKRSNDLGDWPQKNFYDQQIGAALKKAEVFRDAWFRNVAIPSFYHKFVFVLSLFFVFTLGVIPYLLIITGTKVPW